MKSLRKTTFPAVISTFVICFAFWLLITWSLAVQELIAGAVVSLAVSLFAARFFIHEKAFWFLNPVKLIVGLIYCIVIFPIELIKANLDVAFRALSPKPRVNPGFIKVPVGLKSDYGKAMLANSITLTPGTITVDIEQGKNDAGNDECFFYIHWIDVKEKDRVKAGDIIKGTMEKWVRRIFV